MRFTNLMAIKQNPAWHNFQFWLRRHPYAAVLMFSIGAPVFILGTVFAGSAAVMLPISLLMGWI